MAKRKYKEILFVDYFENWIDTYKVGAVRDVTVDKWHNSLRHVSEIMPKTLLSEVDRFEYQRLLNEFAKTHEKQTVTDFHNHVKACLQDAFHDGMIERDPTYKAVIKGKPRTAKKAKFLEKEELSRMLATLDLKNVDINWAVMIAAKTGLRFSELLALTPKDFNWQEQTLTVNKSWNYKDGNGKFDLTKNESSIRTIRIDWQIVGQLAPLLESADPDEPIFVDKKENGEYKKIHNSTWNRFLQERCKEAGVPEITLHSLRHTHASVLIAEGVSIHSVSKRLGHSSSVITQKVYTHILDELRSKDDQKMMAALMQL